jgi:peptidoglycan/xylan/chitin deacetylase (PgdA/CDA1 family)
MMLKNWSPEIRDELLDCLRATTNLSAPTRLLMNWDEVLEMHQSGLVDFGSHTANHVILDQVSLDEARDEIAFSRREIEAHLGIHIELFAFPNGNFNSSLLEVVADNGFTGAVTTKSGWVARDTNVLTLPRVGLHEDVCRDTARFYARLVLQRF